MQYLQIHELERIASQPLCAECAARYEPCAAVWLQPAGGVVHILPVWYGYDGTAWRWLMSQRFCDGMPGSLIEIIRSSKMVWAVGIHQVCFQAKHGLFGNMDFMALLLEKYPELRDQPMVERVLNQLGIDLEAEIAMWVLAGGG